MKKVIYHYYAQSLSVGSDLCKYKEKYDYDIIIINYNAVNGAIELLEGFNENKVYSPCNECHDIIESIKGDLIFK